MKGEFTPVYATASDEHDIHYTQLRHSRSMLDESKGFEGVYY